MGCGCGWSLALSLLSRIVAVCGPRHASVRGPFRPPQHQGPSTADLPAAKKSSVSFIVCSRRRALCVHCYKKPIKNMKVSIEPPKRCTDKTFYDKTSYNKTSYGTKHPKEQNVLRDKTSLGQNVPWTKRPSDKTSLGQNVLRDKTSYTLIFASWTEFEFFEKKLFLFNLFS